MEITPQPLTKEAFAPFGDIIDMPTTAGRFYYDDALGNLRQPRHGEPVGRAQGPDTRPAAHGRTCSSATSSHRRPSSRSMSARWLIVVAPHARSGRPGH